jgi:hypothetical protein
VPWVVSDAPDPQKPDRVFLWLFAKPAKTAIYLMEKCPKTTLGQPTNNVRFCTKNHPMKVYEKLVKRG